MRGSVTSSHSLEDSAETVRDTPQMLMQSATQVDQSSLSALLYVCKISLKT